MDQRARTMDQVMIRVMTQEIVQTSIAVISAMKNAPLDILFSQNILFVLLASPLIKAAKHAILQILHSAPAVMMDTTTIILQKSAVIAVRNVSHVHPNSYVPPAGLAGYLIAIPKDASIPRDQTISTARDALKLKMGDTSRVRMGTF